MVFDGSTNMTSKQPDISQGAFGVFHPVFQGDKIDDVSQTISRNGLTLEDTKNVTTHKGTL